MYFGRASENWKSFRDRFGLSLQNNTVASTVYHPPGVSQPVTVFRVAHAGRFAWPRSDLPARVERLELNLWRSDTVLLSGGLVIVRRHRHGTFRRQLGTRPTRSAKVRFCQLLRAEARALNSNGTRVKVQGWRQPRMIETSGVRLRKGCWGQMQISREKEMNYAFCWLLLRRKKNSKIINETTLFSDWRYSQTTFQVFHICLIRTPFSAKFFWSKNDVIKTPPFSCLHQ